MAEFGDYELFAGQTAGGSGAGQGKNHGLADQPGNRPRSHGGRTYLLVAEHAKQFAKTIYPLVDQAGDGLVGIIARGDAGTPVDDNRIHLPGQAGNGRGHTAGVIGYDLVSTQAVAGLAEQPLDLGPRIVVIGTASVGNRHHGKIHLGRGHVFVWSVTHIRVFSQSHDQANRDHWRPFPPPTGSGYIKRMPLLEGTSEGDPLAATFYIETYGCQMNLADSEIIAGVLISHGYSAADSAEDAAVVLLNTCAIREHAEERVAQRVRHLIARHKRNRRVRVGLAGCMAQHHRERLLQRIPGLDFVVGPDGYRRLPDLIEADRAVADVRLDRRETYEDITSVRARGVRAWVTVQRGCDRFCTFCVVPYVRGRERCIPADIIVEELVRLAADGYHEAVLLGQTVNSYQHDGVDFGRLLRMCSEVDGIKRLRFTSPHPADMDDSTISAMADCAKVSPYLHLPLQSASDRMLKDMDRGYNVSEYRDLVVRLRRAVPELALSTDIIVGYPGESEEDFEATRSFMDEVGYDHAFMFKYSQREGTRAEKIAETVDEEEKGRRLTILIDEQEKRADRINKLEVGKTTEVLVEGPAKRQQHWLAGKNPQFKTVVFEPLGATVGDIATVVVEAAGPHTLKGRQLAD